MSSKKDYKSHIKVAQRYTTANGGTYVKAFDVVRSEAGREVVDKHASMEPCPPKENSQNPNEPNKR